MHRLLKEPPEYSSKTIHPVSGPAKSPRPKKWLRLTLILIGAVLLAGFALLAKNWPFTRSQVVANLEDSMGGHVEIGRFHQTWFPHPGCVAENVIFKGYGNLPNATPITVSKLTIQGSYRGLFTKHVPVLRAEGIHVIAPNAAYFSAWQRNPKSFNATIDEFIATGSVLEFSRGGAAPLKFAISQLKLSRPDAHGVMRFETTIQNPEPPGEVRASGYLGPWKTPETRQTPISGSYSFIRANLGVFHGVAGTLSSDGSFQGTLEQLDVRGKTTTPDFEVTDTDHKMPLLTQFQVTVLTRNGDVVLKPVIARLGRSVVQTEGLVASKEGLKGKTVSLNLLLRDGRIQDFLFLFLNDRTAPMTGRFSFQGEAALPPQKQSFIRRVQLQGDFGIDAAQATNPVTQSNLDQLSESAEGEPNDVPERVVSDLKGHVVLHDGTATFSNLSFHVPGAKAKLHGTYSLLTHRIDLHGTISMQADLPKATKGVKSFLLKIINPFLKKNHHGGAKFPVSITGTYPNPVYKMDPI